ncbi:hypothetical protein QYF36_022158 [Acer negundo]|nr:hypothetical protein QYF36_022158 [Acer negundo]
MVEGRGQGNRGQGNRNYDTQEMFQTLRRAVLRYKEESGAKGSTQVQGGVRCYRCSEMAHRSNDCPKRRLVALVNLVENDDGERAIWEDEIQDEKDQSNDEEEDGIEADLYTFHGDLTAETSKIEREISNQVPNKKVKGIETVIQVREMKTKSGSYFRFLVKWMGRPDYENSRISEEEFMKIDAERCQAAKEETRTESSSLTGGE